MNNTDQISRIENYRKAGANIIPLCEWERLPELHQLIVEEVRLSPNPEDKDVYPQDKKFAIHFQGLTKLALAAGLEWEVDECKAITSSTEYVHYQAVGCIRREFGKRICFKGDAEMDLQCVNEDLVDEYKAKATQYKKDKAWIDYCVNRDFRFKRKHKLKLTATSAKAVVINKILSLKGGYTAAELKNPFVIIRCVVAPDLSDAETRQKLLGMSLQSMAGIFGRPAAAEPARLEDKRFDADVIDLPYDDSPMPEPPMDDDPHPPEPPADYDNPSGMSSGEADFEALGRDEKVKTIRIMVARKGYDLPDLEARRKETLGKFNAKTLLGLFRKLAEMPDIAKGGK